MPETIATTQALAMRRQIKDSTEPISVYLTPLNEGQDSNYMERFRGTPMQVVGRCHAIILGLHGVLKDGTWSVQVESANADGSFCGKQSVRIDLDKVFDSDFNVIADIGSLGAEGL